MLSIFAETVYLPIIELLSKVTFIRLEDDFADELSSCE